MSEIKTLAEKLRSEGEKFFAIFSGLTDEHWQTEVYTEGTTWTIRNVLSHFVTSERGLIKLFEQIRQGGAGASKDFSIDRYNASMQARNTAPPIIPASPLRRAAQPSFSIGGAKWRSKPANSTPSASSVSTK